MAPETRSPLVIGILIVIMLALGVGFYLARDKDDGTASPQDGAGPVTGDANGNVELRLGQTGTVGAVSITPRAIVEDSRCPTDVQCIQAGTVRVRADLVSGLGTANQVFLLGEPITTEAEAVTLLEVRPAPVSTREIQDADYRFTFKVESRAITYVNASADRIRVETPPPGAVVGKQFMVRGQARGGWFFEASFPIDVLDRSGNKLTTVVATAEGEWMTNEFVPFSASVTIPASYTGPATLVLNRDNASGLPEHDASASYTITVEF